MISLVIGVFGKCGNRSGKVKDGAWSYSDEVTNQSIFSKWVPRISIVDFY